jgi:hypothetical protein
VKTLGCGSLNNALEVLVAKAPNRYCHARTSWVTTSESTPLLEPYLPCSPAGPIRQGRSGDQPGLLGRLDRPNQCRSRSDVIATLDLLLGEGVEGTLTETVTGPNGVAVLLHVDWPNPGEGRGKNFWQAYLVAGGLVTEIRRLDDRVSAIAAISG